MEFLKYGPVKAVFALLAAVVLLPSVFAAADKSIDENLAIQSEHTYYLENEYYKNYTPCDEEKVTGFDVDSAVKNAVKFNEVRFIGTHNSYQLQPTDAYKKMYEALDVASFGIASSKLNEFCSDFLTEQFELGIRSIELDIETVVKDGKTGFVVSHEPLVDITSNCYDFSEALREIKLWSDNNPSHLPITVIIEPKKGVPTVGGMKNFSLSYANELDKMLRDILGESLLTPAEMMGEYSDFKQMRENDGWPTLEKTLGKVLVLLHETTVTDKYIKQDTSIKSQAMFPMLRYSDISKSYASFIIENNPQTAEKHRQEVIEENKLIVRTRADSYTSYSDKKYASAVSCGAQIVSTDYPVKVNSDNSHTFDFGNRQTVTTK